MMLTWKNAKRLVVFVIGMSVVLVGVVMIVLPGPAIIVIPLGLAILATEFIWAKRLLDRVKKQAGVVFSSHSTKNRPPDDPEARSS